ncbi:MAG: signal peptidase I [Velocimicrobium sp.]
MDRFREYIDAVLKGICISKKRKQEMQDELYDHLNMLKDELIQEGYSKEEAESIAIKRFGDTTSIQKELRHVLTPFREWSRQWRKKNVPKMMLEYASIVVFALFISLSIHSYVFAATQVQQSSMKNTLQEGQRLIENKLTYNFSKPERGDIVIIDKERKAGALHVFLENGIEMVEAFSNKEKVDNKRLVKRVIGIPGDTVDIKNGRVFINEALYEETYTRGDTYPNSMKFPIVIPEKEYFVMGDNREVSLDSRDLGLFSIDAIEGKVTARLWPLNELGLVE